MPFLFLLSLLLLFTPCLADQPGSGSGGINAPRHLDAPYVVLVSIDGFRWDYVDRREARALRAIAEQGVLAERLLPVFPTLTFPNHYSIVTGLYPSHHGIVSNDFPLTDGSWYRIRARDKVQDGTLYGGTPVWVAAETQGMVTASFFWVGSEADVQGVRPTHYRLFDKQVKPAQRTKQVLTWLKAPRPQRPHFITLYFEQVDDYSHWYGTGEKETSKTIGDISGQLGRLWRGIQRLPHGDQVNMIVVSDHGQANFHEPYRPFSLEGLVDLAGVEAVNGDSYLFLHFDRADPARAAHIRDLVNEHWRHGKAWLPEDAPPAWHLTRNSRLPDVILVADVGHGIVSSHDKAGDFHPGDHGWRPEAPEMHGIFIASGPAFRKGLTTGPVRNVDIYPLIMDILGLEAPDDIDSDPAALRHILAVNEAGSEQ